MYLSLLSALSLDVTNRGRGGCRGPSGYAIFWGYAWGRLGHGAFGFFAVAVNGSSAKLLLDAEKLVVLGHTV